jgi:hypothetical protein
MKNWRSSGIMIGISPRESGQTPYSSLGFYDTSSVGSLVGLSREEMIEYHQAFPKNLFLKINAMNILLYRIHQDLFPSKIRGSSKPNNLSGFEFP